MASDQMMTLSALAYTDQTTIKDAQTGQDETVSQQSQRLLRDLNDNPAYGLNQVATTSTWTAIRVGLTADRANLAYIAQSQLSANTYAVAIRGSDFALFIDSLENFRVQDVVPFPGGGHVATGAMQAFTNVTQAQYLSAGGQGANLLETLTGLVNAAPAGQKTTVYVTGHSLGGAIASTISLYLLGQMRNLPVLFQVYTFAAPTAGDQDFAKAFDAAFPGTVLQDHSSWRVYNAYDVVPNAWQTLTAVRDTYYPNPGPTASMEVKLMIDGMRALASGITYVHPNAAGTPHAVELNGNYNLRDQGHLGTNQHGFWGYLANDTQAFMGQLAFQHGCNAYLSLLGVPNVSFQT